MQNKVNAITTGVLSLTALNGTQAVSEQIANVTATPDIQGVLSVVLQLVVAISTLFKLFKKETKKENTNVDGQ